jgi:hypothetical protein
MRALAWIAFAVLAALWTATAWLGASLLDWSAQALQGAGTLEAAREMASMPLPAWLAIWIDPAWVGALQSFALWLADVGGSWLPAAGTVAGWVAPLVWMVWGFGMVLLVVGAVTAHLLLGRFARRGASRT